MGKRITSQARGKGSLTFRVRKQAYKYKIKYAGIKIIGNGKVLKLVNSLGHFAPLAKIQVDKEIFYNPANSGLFEGQEISIGEDKVEVGNIVALKHLKLGDRIFNDKVPCWKREFIVKIFYRFPSAGEFVAPISI